VYGREGRSTGKKGGEISSERNRRKNGGAFAKEKGEKKKYAFFGFWVEVVGKKECYCWVKGGEKRGRKGIFLGKNNRREEQVSIPKKKEKCLAVAKVEKTSEGKEKKKKGEGHTHGADERSKVGKGGRDTNH